MSCWAAIRRDPCLEEDPEDPRIGIPLQLYEQLYWSRPSSTLSLSGASVSGCRRESGKKQMCNLPPSLLPAIFHAGNFLILLWFSYLG